MKLLLIYYGISKGISKLISKLSAIVFIVNCLVNKES